MNPTDLFDILAVKHIESGNLPNYFSPAKFKKLRIESERLAREELFSKTGSHEVTLEEIYQKFSHLYQGRFDPRIGVDVEEAEELENIYINPVVISLIKKIKSRFKSIIVVSDIYLSSKFLRKVLVKNGIEGLIDKIYVSCEYRTGKSQDLFNQVKEMEGSKFNRMFHIGDNFHSDYQTPISKGIKCFHLPNGLSETWELFFKESLLLHNNSTVKQNVSELTTIGAIQSARTALSSAIGELDCYQTTGSTVFGPIFYGYSQWVIEQTESLENPLYVGLYREGATVVDILKRFDPKINIAKLGISRRVINTLNLSEELNLENLKNLLPERNSIHIDDLLKNILLEDLTIDDEWKGHFFRKDSHSSAVFFKKLLSNDSFVQSWKLKLTQYKERFFEHFSKTILTNEFSHIVLVDVGWSGSIQKTLVANNFINSEKVIGLYLALNNGSLNHNNDRKAGYLIDCFNTNSLDDFSLRNVEIFEQALTPNLGSTVDFNHGCAIFDKDLIPEEQRKQSFDLQSGIFSFIDYMKNSNSIKRVDFEYLRKLNRVIFNRFNLIPSENEIKLFKSWLHDDNVSNLTEKMVPSYLSIFSENFTLYDFLNGDFAHFYWPFGLREKFFNHELLSLLSYEKSICSLQTLKSFDTRVFNKNNELIVSSNEIDLNSLGKFYNKLYTISDSSTFSFELSSSFEFMLNGVVVYYEHRGLRKVRVLEQNNVLITLSENNNISGKLIFDFPYDFVTGFAFPSTLLRSTSTTPFKHYNDSSQLLDTKFHIDEFTKENVGLAQKSIFIRGWCFNQSLQSIPELYLEIQTDGEKLQSFALVRQNRNDVNAAYNFDSTYKAGFEGHFLLSNEKIKGVNFVVKSGYKTLSFDVLEELK